MVDYVLDLCGNQLYDASLSNVQDACANFIPDHVDASCSDVSASVDCLFTDPSGIHLTIVESNEHLLNYEIQFPITTNLEGYTLTNPTLTLYQISGSTLSMITTAPIAFGDTPDSLSGNTITADLPVSTSLKNLTLYLEFTAEMEGATNYFVNVLSSQFSINFIPDSVIVQVLVDDANMNYFDGIPVRVVNPNAVGIEELWFKILTFESGALHSNVVVINETSSEAIPFPILQDQSRNFQFAENLVADQKYYFQVKALYVGGVASSYTEPTQATFTTRVGQINEVSWATAFNEDGDFLQESASITFTLPFDATRYGRTVDSIAFSHTPFTLDTTFTNYIDMSNVQVLDLTDETEYTVDNGNYTYIVNNFTTLYLLDSTVYALAHADTRWGVQKELVVPGGTRSQDTEVTSLNYVRLNQSSDFNGNEIVAADRKLQISWTLAKGSRSLPFTLSTPPFNIIAALSPFDISFGTIDSLRITAVALPNIDGTFRASLAASHAEISCTTLDGVAFPITFDSGTAYTFQDTPTDVSFGSISQAYPNIEFNFTKGSARQDSIDPDVYTRFGKQDLDSPYTITWFAEDTSLNTKTFAMSFGRNSTILAQPYTQDLNDSDETVYGDITQIPFNVEPAIDSLQYVSYSYLTGLLPGRYFFNAVLEQYGMETGTVISMALVNGDEDALYYDPSTHLLTTESSGNLNPLFSYTSTVVVGETRSLAPIAFELRDDIENWADFNISVQLTDLSTAQTSPLYTLKKENGSTNFVYTLMPVRAVVADSLTAADSTVVAEFHMDTDTGLSYTGVEAQYNYGSSIDASKIQGTTYSAQGVNITTPPFTATEVVADNTLDGGVNSYIQMQLRAYLLDPNETTPTTRIYSAVESISSGPIDFVFPAPVLAMVEPDRDSTQVTYTVRTTVPREPEDSLLTVNSIFVMTDASSALTCFPVVENTSYALVVHSGAIEDPALLPSSALDLSLNVLFVRQSNLAYDEDSTLRVWFVADASSALTFVDPSFNPALPANAKYQSTTGAFRPYKEIVPLDVLDYREETTKIFDLRFALFGDFPKQLIFVYFYHGDEPYDTYTFNNLTAGTVDSELSTLPMFTTSTNNTSTLALHMQYETSLDIAAIFVFGVGTGRPVAAGQVVALDGYSFFKSYTLPDPY